MKKIVFLLLAFLGLAAFVYFYEIEGGKKREEAKSLEEKLFQLQQEEISFVEIERPGAEKVVLAREGHKWFLREPLQTGADETTVDSLVRNLAFAERARTFDQSEISLEELGLADPRLTLVVGGGDTARKLLVGNKDFTGNNVYVRFEDEPSVHLTSDYVFNTADKELFDWRSKKVLEIERARVQAIELQRPSGRLSLRKEGEGWQLEAPLEEEADSSTVGTLLSTLEFAEARSFVSEKPEDLGRYGLENPAVWVRVREEGQDQWKTLQLGRAEGEDGYLAHNPALSPVFTVSRDLYERLTQDVWEFRNRDVVALQQDEVSRLAIRRGEEPELVILHQDYNWTIEEPEDQKGKRALSYNFWYPMGDIRFTSIEDRLRSFPQADVQIVIETRSGERRTYEFARAGDSYLARQVETNRQGTISREDFEKLQFKVEDLVE